MLDSNQRSSYAREFSKLLQSASLPIFHVRPAIFFRPHQVIGVAVQLALPPTGVDMLGAASWYRATFLGFSNRCYHLIS